MEESSISLEDWIDQLKERESINLDRFYKDLVDTQGKYLFKTRKATTLQELNFLKKECVDRKQELKRLVLKRGNHLGIRYKPNFSKVEGILNQYFKALDESIEYIDVSIEALKPLNNPEKQELQNPTTFEDLFKPEYK